MSRRRAMLGDLIATAYEQARRETKDPESRSRLAMWKVVHFLLRTGNLRAARALAESI